MNSIHNIMYTVSDLDAAKAIHAALLDAEPHTDESYYVGFNVGGVEIALRPMEGQGTQEGQGPQSGENEAPSETRPGPVAHVAVPDLDAALAAVQQAGAKVADEPKDVGGGARVATVTDPDGYLLGLIQGS